MDGWVGGWVGFGGKKEGRILGRNGGREVEGRKANGIRVDSCIVATLFFQFSYEEEKIG